MRLFLRFTILIAILLNFNSFSAIAQNCPGSFALFPDTVCAGQPFSGTNFGPSNAQYQWDFCGGDLGRTPTISQIALGSNPLPYIGLDIVEEGGKFYGFYSSASNLIRMDFDTSVQSPPVITNLGTFGGILVNSSGIKLRKQGNTWFGFAVNKTTAEQMIRFTFANGLSQPPTAQVIQIQGLNSCNGIDIISEGNSFFGLGYNQQTGTVLVLRFGSSLSATPTVFPLSGVPALPFMSVLMYRDCTGSYGFISDNGGRLVRLNFGNSYANPNPTITTLAIPNVFSISSMSIMEDGGRKVILGGGLFSGQVVLLNFGSSFQNNFTFSQLAGASPQIFGLSKPIFNSNGSSTFLYSIFGGAVGRINFPAGNCILPAGVRNFTPPIVASSSPGKIFINYKMIRPSGEEVYGSDSVVVVSQNSTTPFPSLDFLTDDQCPSKPTRFISRVNPAGIYVYRWVFPGGLTSGQAIATRQFPDTGVYPVSLTLRGQGGCGVSTITRNVRIYANPSQTITSDFSFPALVCTKDSVLFQNTSSPDSIAKRWIWDFGNDRLFTTKNVKFYFPISSAGQTFQVSMKASDSSGCGTTITKPITPQLGADVLFSSGQFCEGQNTNFQNLTPNPSAVGFLWTFGDTASGSANFSSSDLPQVQHLFSDTGLYRVSLRGIVANGCTSTIAQNVRIYENPRMGFSNPGFAAPGLPVNFTNTSKANRQTFQNILWNFGDPASGTNNTSNQLNPSHNYGSTGTYPVSLSITTNQNCSNQFSKSVLVYPVCPQISVTKIPSASGDFDTLTLNNTTNLISATNIDFCSGDLEFTPILQTQQTGTPPIANASQIIPVKDANRWIGFIPSPPGNATVLWKASFGNSLNNDISNFSSSLGSLQSRFPNPVFFRFVKEDTNWYAFASNGDSRLWRLAFGANIQNDSPVITEISLPAGTLINPYNAQIVKYKDTTFVFIVNSANQSNNTFVRLRFSRSIVDTPNVFVLNNPPVLQNSNGFFGVSFVLDCENWYGYLIGSSQLYRLNFGNSLNRIPAAVALTGEITAGISSPNAFNNLRGISILQDKGAWYGFINTNAANIFRFRLAKNILQPLEAVSNLGSFGIQGVVGPINYTYENSEFFGLGINNAGTVFKLKFPNLCPATIPFVRQTEPGTASTVYRSPGKYFFTTTSETAYGAYRQILDSVSIAQANLPKTCFTTALNHPEELCFDFKFNPNVSQTNLNNVEWDFCTGDFGFPPASIGIPAAAVVGNPTGNQVVQVGNNYYSFVCSPSGLFRINLQGPDGISPAPVAVAVPSGSFNTVSDFRIFKEGNDWFALLVYLNGETMVRLNFGPDITNVNPNFAIINLAGILNRPRGVSLFEDKGNKYAAVSNQNNGTISLLNFGSSYRNIPNAATFNVPGSISLFKVSVIRDCNIWHAFLTDLQQDSVYQLTFIRGLESAPVSRMLPMMRAAGLQAVKDGSSFYLFATKIQNNFNNLFRFSFGNNLSNRPKIDSLGNFGATAATGFNSIQNFHIYRNELSENYFFGYGNVNAVLYRLKFQNQCSASKPIFSGDTVFNQSYGADGKYYFSASGFDNSGNQFFGFDSVIVKNQVQAGFAVPGNRCKGEPVLFTDTSVPGIFTNIISWKWDFGDTTLAADTSNLQNPTFTFPKAGLYPVKLTVKEQFGCENELIRNIRIADKPRPNFEPAATGTLCTNDSIQFNDLSQSSLDSIVERNWEVRQNGVLLASSGKKNPKFLFTQTGLYQISLRIMGESQCDSSLTKTITIGGNGALVSFTNPAPCLGELISFSPNISGAAPDSVAWFVDAAKLSNQSNFSNVFNSANFFTVRLVVYSGACANNFSKTIRVNARPLFTISDNTPLKCQSLPFNFNTTISITEEVKYDWDFGDGTGDTVRNPLKTFQNAGNFRVILNVSTLNGCDAEDTLFVTAKRAPKAEFSFDKACKDEPVTFINTSNANGIPGGITSYFWEFGNLIAQTSTLPNPPPVFYNEAPGPKTVKLTVRTAEDCPNTFTRIITIGTKLAANYRIETGCIGTPFRFFDQSDAGQDTVVQWQWSIGGLNFTTRNPVVEFDLQGTYDVRLRVISKAGCEDEITRTDEFTVLDSAKADFSFSNPVFNNGTFTVVFRQVPSANPSYDYLWDFGDSTSSTSANPPPHIYTRQGTYLVTLVATRAGTICSTRIQKVVNAILNPVQGLKLKDLKLGRSETQTSLAIEIENQSNIALRSFDVVTRLGNLATLREKWQGILLPGQVISYPLKSDILTRNSQNIQIVCVEARLPDPGLESSPADNQKCLSADSVPAIVALFPNPATRELNLELNIPVNDPLAIRIFNAMGQEMQSFEVSEPQTGAFRKTIDVSGYPPGIYYLRFSSGKREEHKTFMVHNE